MDPIKILIAVPTFENIEPDCFKSIYGLTRPKNTIFMFDFVRGYDCARARNLIVKEALEYNFDYVLMVDSDMQIPRHTISSMLGRNKDIVMGWYMRKQTKINQTETFALGQKDFTNENNIKSYRMPPNTCMEIKGGGFGVALIKTDVFRKMGNSKWFQYIEYEDNAVLSEDNYFCVRAAANGYKIYCDTSVKAGHIQKIIGY